MYLTLYSLKLHILPRLDEMFSEETCTFCEELEANAVTQ